MYSILSRMTQMANRENEKRGLRSVLLLMGFMCYVLDDIQIKAASDVLAAFVLCESVLD